MNDFVMINCDRKVFLDNFVTMEQNYFNDLIILHYQKGYKKICFENNLIDFSILLSDVTYEIFNGHEIVNLLVTDNIIKARTEILNAIGELTKLLKNKCSLFAISGYDEKYDDDNHYSCGIIDPAGNYYECFSAEILQNEKYQIKMIYNNHIIYAINEYFKKFHIINHLISPHCIGGVLLQNEKPGINDKGREYFNRFSSVKYIQGDAKLTAKDKFAYVENNGVQVVVELNYRGLHANKVSLKNVANNECIDVMDDVIESKVFKIFTLNETYLYKQSMTFYYQITNNKFADSNVQIKKVCDDKKHIENYLKEEYFIIRPFNQRLKKQKCECCESFATKELLILKNKN